MKKFYLLACFSFVMLGVQAQLFTEAFDYTPHATNGLAVQSGGTWTRINSGDSILVVSGSLSYPGLPASTGNKVAYDGSGADYWAGYTAQTSGSVYYSFILNVTSLGTHTTTGGYFTTLVQAGSTSAFGGAVWTRLSSTAGKFNVGVSTRSNSAVSWLPADLDPGTSYFIVASYDIVSGTANDVARIWLNTSAIGGAEPAPDATAVPGTDLSTAGVGRVLLRQDNTSNTPFIEFDELRVGTTWAEVTPGGSVATLSATTLAGFGNVCINSTAGPNSFTINGSNLSTADVTVAALAGYSYSTTSGGTYTPTLTLSQPGGTFSQQVFVRFEPTAVQSYNGNIVVSGGGATPVNVAASGAGINSMASVTTGGTTNLTMSSATAEGTISNTGCSAVTAYGIEYSTTNNFTPGTGTQVPSTNLSGGNFSSDLTGLSSGTTYYYIAYATNAGGTAYGAQQSFTTLTPNPTLVLSSLTGFGNVCINSSGGPNSFTITGSNLTNADVTVAALAGYRYATSAGGPFTATLTLTQPGGAYSQEVFVLFEPTAVQSYNGNITVSGGGAGSVNAAVTGQGVNTTATVSTGAASAITQTTATAAGNISSNGCSSVTAYGIEFSTTNNFTPGTGTQVPASNLTGGNFSAGLTGLSSNTTYYYRAYATNAGGTAYGSQLSFTTAAPVLTVGSLTPFGDVCVNNTAGPNTFTISGAGLSAANIQVGALAGYSYSTTAGGSYTPTLSLTQPGGNYNQTIYVRFSPTAVQSYNGNIAVSGGGSVGAQQVAASGEGVNTLATVVTGAATGITTHSATVEGIIGSNGCSDLTGYGIEYSGVPGFANGNGVKVAGMNLSGGNFSVSLNGLVQGATYYYKAYAINGGGISYGLQESFTVGAIGEGYRLYPVPVERGQMMRVTMNEVTPGYYGLLFYNSDGKLVFQHNMNIQAGFINQEFAVPATLPPGVYRVTMVNFERVIHTRSILIL